LRQALRPLRGCLRKRGSLHVGADPFFRFARDVELWADPVLRGDHLNRNR